MIYTLLPSLSERAAAAKAKNEEKTMLLIDVANDFHEGITKLV
jgi:hypothetical protein